MQTKTKIKTKKSGSKYIKTEAIMKPNTKNNKQECEYNQSVH